MKRSPKRRCVGCMLSFDKGTLIRIAAKHDCRQVIDLKHREDGRGTYIFKSIDCLNKAVKRKSFERIFKRTADKDFYYELEREILKHEPCRLT